MSGQASRLGRALSFSYNSSCPKPDCVGADGACTCHSGVLLFNNLQLSTVSCSLDQQPRAVSLHACSISNNNEAPTDCDKMVDTDWEGGYDRVTQGGL